MDIKDATDIRNSILKLAEKLLYYNTLLIEQCDSWLPAEEGNRYMEKCIAERRKKNMEATLAIDLQSKMY